MVRCGSDPREGAPEGTGSAGSRSGNHDSSLSHSARDRRLFARGAQLPTLTASYTGFVNGDAAANLHIQPTTSTTATAASATGAYAITASGALDPNYTISYVDGTLTITSASLTITAVNQTKVYGDVLPTLTVSYSGFVNGDTAESLTIQATLTTTAKASSHV